MIFDISVLLYFFLGLAFGSFANVLILRLHSGEKGIFTGRSHCTSCNHELSFWDLVPFFSWVFLKGKCRYCKKPISIQYPIVELLMGIMFVIALIASQNLWLYQLWLMLIFFFFLIIFVYDLKYMEIPDEVSLPAIIILFGFTYFSFTPSWSDALIGVSIPIIFFGIQYLVSKGKWIGEGDFRLGALMGIILGWKLTIVALFVAYILGSIVAIVVLVQKKKGLSSKLPFGPFLILGTLITLFYGENLLSWYLRCLGF